MTHTGSFSLQQYLPECTIEPPQFPAEAAACFGPLLSGLCGTGLGKWIALRAVRRALIKKRCLGKFSLHLPIRREPLAYMNDAGKVYLSTGLLAKTSAMTVLSVYCHELSHILLSQQTCYPALKQLQRQFRQQFGGHQQWQLLSPIEYITMRICRTLLAEIAAANPGHKRKLQPLTEDLDEKLSALEAALATLAQTHDI